mgnify:CR=1 FL=1
MIGGIERFGQYTGSARTVELPRGSGTRVTLGCGRTYPGVGGLAGTGCGDGAAADFPVSEGMEADEDKGVKKYLEAIAARVRVSGLDVHTRSERSVTSHAAEVIAAVLAKQPAGIAIMASHGRGGVLRWALGSTAEEVLDQSSCPILIVRAGTTAAGSEAVPAFAALRAG